VSERIGKHPRGLIDKLAEELFESSAFFQPTSDSDFGSAA
jgi:hypothetical protein